MKLVTKDAGTRMILRQCHGNGCESLKLSFDTVFLGAACVFDDCVEVAVSSETSVSTHKPARWLSPRHYAFVTIRIYAFAGKSCKNVPVRFVLSVCSPVSVDVTTIETLNDLN
jgi:hypothetical protein